MGAFIPPNTAEVQALQSITGITTGAPSLHDLRTAYYGGKVSQNDAIRAYLQSQLGNTSIQSLTDLWRLFFIFKGVTNRVSLGDMARDFFTNVGFSPAVVIPNIQVKVGTFIGDGTSSHGITGIGFKPDAVLIKGGSQPLQMSLSSMGANATKPLSGGDPVYSNGVVSLDTDGFTTGGSSLVNANGTVYYYVALKDPAKGFMHVGTYTGDGVDGHAITGVGFQADVIITGASDGDNAVFKTSDMPTDGAQLFDNFGNLGARITAIGVDGFTLGPTNEVNKPAQPYYYIALKKTTNICATLSYTGNGVDNRNIATNGFQPEFILIKDNSNAPDSAIRFKDEVGDLSFVSGGAEAANRIQSFITGGFQVGTDSTVNTNGDTYVSFSLKA